MTIDDACREVDRLKLLLRSEIPQLAFESELHFPDVFFCDAWDKDVPAPGISKRSGVYLVLDECGRAIYIGKATKNNLAAEIYNRKFKTVTSKDPVRFGNSELAQFADDPAVAEKIRAGKVKLGAFVIEPPELSSLVEVFLQTMCWRRRDDQWWPRCNRRIG